MADYKEVRVERLFLKVPNTEKLRKGAAGRHKHLLADGWREVVGVNVVSRVGSEHATVEVTVRPTTGGPATLRPVPWYARPAS